MTGVSALLEYKFQARMKSRAVNAMLRHSDITRTRRRGTNPRLFMDTGEQNTVCWRSMADGDEKIPFQQDNKEPFGPGTLL